ncbi:class I SAM-dependent methyltransferase [Defluviimonas sp. SAOS-178_SWC]|uniref:class I SAM-dependent methyltransferase n=1 Tax=Defluviimonas sp. SAOS-178_SWC TaxID=3121287 RepID=UPI003221DA73
MTTNAATAGQVSKPAAQIYDEFFVPALFGRWAAPLCEAAQIGPGQEVLDIACGTGATTRAAASRVGPEGRVVGLDRNRGMLDVAQSRAPTVKWIEAVAEALPFADGVFDAVLCQFGLMFFDDRTKALNEMARVVRPGGRIALSVWDDVARSPGYAGMIALIQDMFGDEAAEALRAPFILGDKRVLLRILEDAGWVGTNLTTATGTARFASIRDWVRMDVRGWTLGDFIDDDGFEALVTAAEECLGEYAASDGTVEFPAPAHIAVWKRKPEVTG